ncbi:MAG TPA: threonine synthase [Burkholderiaceae bacterium]|nr:threonine synthase [Burkholderiaceae bacterium]
MKYLSTRGDAAARAFSEILLEGLAPDGGLYLPERYPRVDAATLARWRALPYADLAFEILSLYIDDIPADDLRAMCRKVYTRAVFGSDVIVPLRQLESGLWIEGLSNGPTLAFKDMAMQLLGALFEYELTRRGERLNILGATSGDTGSAAEYAMRGKRGVQVFMLSPHGRMSPFQQAQMYSLPDANIHNIAIEGVFDDCQDIVKAVAGDLTFKRAHRIGSVNSINWARLVAQVVYYFAGWFQATSRAPNLGSASVPPEGAAPPWGGPAAARDDERVSFAVPSGNFGNVCAGHVARMMGLPIARLIVATNENDVLDEFFKTGRYRVRAAAETHETSSPSMDISKASNFERFVCDLLQRDTARTRELFGERITRDGGFALDAATHARCAEFGFVSGSSTHADRVATIRQVWRQHRDLIDPHTADGIKVARDLRRPGEFVVALETALPIKFAETIVEAIGEPPARPSALQGLEDLPSRVTVLPPSADRVKALIAAHDPA